MIVRFIVTKMNVRGCDERGDAPGDVVSDGENGLVFRATIATDLAEKIQRLLEDASLYNRLASAGRQSVVDRFDWQQVGARYRSIIDQCLEQ